MIKEFDIDEQLRALADPVRLRVVKLLALPMHSRGDTEGQGLCACDIESVMGVGQSTVSHHMKLLLKAGLVSSEKKGRWVYYRLNQAAFGALAQAIARFAGSTAECVALGPSLDLHEGAQEGPDEQDGQGQASCCTSDAAATPGAAPAGKRLRVVAKRRQG